MEKPKKLIVLVTKICEYCNTEFKTSNKDKKFCTRICQNQSYWTEKRRKERSIKSKEIWNRPNFLEKMSEISSFNQNKIEYKEKRSKIAKEINSRPEVIEQHRNNTIKLWQQEEYRTKNLNSRIEFWKDKEKSEEYIKSCLKYKDFIMPSGKIVKIQGYEPQFLTELLKTYQEDDIIIRKRIHYQFKEKEHNYFPDFFIKSKNWIIEVKSEWTFKQHEEQNLAKRKACLKQGYNFSFVIFNKRGTIWRYLE